MKNAFTIRVYGLLLQKNRILVCDEFHHDLLMTKFPGGGLQFGEGTHDCLKREMLEELDLAIAITNHFYTTDFFQPSAFDPKVQVLSIYYLVQPLEPFRLSTAKAVPGTGQSNNGDPVFKWIGLDRFTPDDVTMPIDKKVAALLIQSLANGRMP